MAALDLLQQHFHRVDPQIDAVIWPDHDAAMIDAVEPEISLGVTPFNSIAVSSICHKNVTVLWKCSAVVVQNG